MELKLSTSDFDWHGTAGGKSIVRGSELPILEVCVFVKKERVGKKNMRHTKSVVEMK